jgi:pyrimidine-nucleoside phosphorylase
MNVARLIQAKRDGHRLVADDIAALVRGYVGGEIPDYQMAALAMAIFFRGMEADETAALTDAMLGSGATLEWTAPAPVKVDKHSTGGVGDKVSLILAPLLASCGLQVPMLSGRGLGTTGGTLDKLEAIPGFRTDLGQADIRAITERVGCVITGTTADLVPADRSLYGLRDVTATVESIPLITASIMSKKLAENLGALVLDVKFGSGALMKTEDQARRLARSLVATGDRMGLKTSALLTDMNQPLGRMVGHAVEVDEALATLAGNCPADVTELVRALGAELLVLAGAVADAQAALDRLDTALESGHALAKFHAMVAAQGGDLAAPRHRAPAGTVASAVAGFVTLIHTEQLGQALVDMGGGRRQKGDRIDPSVGLEMLVRLGDRVEPGQPLVRVFADDALAQRVRPQLAAALVVGSAPPAPTPLIRERVTAEA